MRHLFRTRVIASLVVLWLGGVATAFGQPRRQVGTVRDEGGRPIHGATVTAESADTSFTTTTDEDGHFGFVTLVADVWIFTVRAPGFTPSQRTTRVRNLRSTIATQSRNVRNPPLEFALARGAIGLGVASLAGVDTSELQEKLQSAATAHSEGRYDEAIRTYREIVTRAPALTMVNLKLARAYLENGNYEEAQTAYQFVMESDLEPSIGRDVFYDFGDIRLTAQNTEEARGWYWKAHNVDPAWSKPLLKLGRIALSASDLATARMYLEMAVDAEPGSAESGEARALLAELNEPR